MTKSKSLAKRSMTTVSKVSARNSRRRAYKAVTKWVARKTGKAIVWTAKQAVSRPTNMTVRGARRVKSRVDERKATYASYGFRQVIVTCAFCSKSRPVGKECGCFRPAANTPAGPWTGHGVRETEPGRVVRAKAERLDRVAPKVPRSMTREERKADMKLLSEQIAWNRLCAIEKALWEEATGSKAIPAKVRKTETVCAASWSMSTGKELVVGSAFEWADSAETLARPNLNGPADLPLFFANVGIGAGKLVRFMEALELYLETAKIDESVVVHVREAVATVNNLPNIFASARNTAEDIYMGKSPDYSVFQ